MGKGGWGGDEALMLASSVSITEKGQQYTAPDTNYQHKLNLLVGDQQ